VQFYSAIPSSVNSILVTINNNNKQNIKSLTTKIKNIRYFLNMQPFQKECLLVFGIQRAKN